ERLEFLLEKADAAGDLPMMGELVVYTADASHGEDGQLPEARIEGEVVPHAVAVREEPPEQPGSMGEHPEEVEHGPAVCQQTVVDVSILRREILTIQVGHTRHFRSPLPIDGQAVRPPRQAPLATGFSGYEHQSLHPPR